MAGLGAVAARGARVVLSAQLIRLAIQMASLIVMSRLLTPGEVGLVAMVTAVINVADLVRDFGLSSGAIQAKELTTAQRDNLFWINLGLGAACTLVAAAIAPLLAYVYDQPDVLLITLILSGSFIISGATTQYRAGLTRELKFRHVARIDIGAQFIATATAIAMAFAGFGYWAIVAQQLVNVTCALLGNLLASRWRPGLPQRGVGTRRFFAFGGPVLGTNLMGYALNNVDNMGLGIVSGPVLTGLYVRAYQLLMVPLGVLNGPMSSVAFPVLARVQDDDEQFLYFVGRFHLISAYLFGLGFGVMAGLAWPIVGILLGDQWAAAAPIVAVLAMGGIFKALTMVFFQVYVSRGATGQLFRLYLWTRPLMLATILAGLPWGPIGVAWGHLVAAVAFWAYSLWRVGALTRLPIAAVAWESVRAVVLLAVPMALIGIYVCTLTENNWLQLAGALLAMGVWFGFMWSVPAVRSDLRAVVAAARLAFSRET